MKTLIPTAETVKTPYTEPTTVPLTVWVMDLSCPCYGAGWLLCSCWGD